MAHDILVVTEAELRRSVKLDMDAIDTVERAFAALASIVGRWRSDGRLMLAGERACYALSGMMITASQVRSTSCSRRA